MKKLNKLLPLIGSSAIIAAATPLAFASCSSNELHVTEFDLTSSKGDYQYPKNIARFTPTAQTQTDELSLTDLYINEIKNNPAIFTSDLVYCQSKRFVEIINQVASDTFDTKIDSFVLKVSDFKADTTEVMIPQQKSFTIPTISFNWDANIQITTKDTKTLNQTDKFTLVASNKIKNCPIFCYDDSQLAFYNEMKAMSDQEWIMPDEELGAEGKGLGHTFVGFVFDTIGLSDVGVEQGGLYSYNLFNLYKSWELDVNASITLETTTTTKQGTTSTDTKKVTLSKKAKHNHDIKNMYDEIQQKAEVDDTDISRLAYTLYNVVGYDFYSYHMGTIGEEI